MDPAPAPSAPYAVLRVDRRKAKALAAIAASSAHQLRQRPTPNADPAGPAPIAMYLAAGETPYQAACALLDGAERRNKTTVLCREVVLSAGPSYFRPGREERGGDFDPARMKAWATRALLWAKRQWPDQLASFVLHLDEQTVHAHCMVVPRVAKPGEGWKLNSKALFDRQRLRELQTSYGEAMKALGMRRGEPGSNAQHSEIRQFYGAIAKAHGLATRRAAPAAPKAPPKPQLGLKRALLPIAKALGMTSEITLVRERYELKRREWQAAMKRHRQEEDQRWQQLAMLAAAAPLRGRQRRAAAPLSSAPAREPAPRPKHCKP